MIFLPNLPEEEANPEELEATDGEAEGAGDGGDALSEDEALAKEMQDMADASQDDLSDLSQDEIDNLLGFDVDNIQVKGTALLLETSANSYEKYPLLESTFEKMVRSLSTRLRNFTSENIEVFLESTNSMRYEEYMNSVPLPAVFSIFQASEWGGLGLITIDTNLAYSVIDALLGGGKVSTDYNVAGRDFTAIEQNLIRELSEILIEELNKAINTITNVTIRFDTLETNPKFVSIARPASPCIIFSIRIYLNDKSGNAIVLLPYSTLESVKSIFTQIFTTDTIDSDISWEVYLGKDMQETNVLLEAVLGKTQLNLNQIANLEKGKIIVLDTKLDKKIKVKCEEIDILESEIGSRDEKMAVKILHNQIASFNE